MVNRAREWWERLGRTNQLTLVLTTLAMVGALIGLTVWASTPEYVPLFSNLSAQDANAIREKLVETNVPSRLTTGGTGIEVPAQYVDETRMKMISAGLPQQSPTATTDDIFSKNTMAMTSEMEKLAMQRSLEDRVSKSIMSLSPVSNATVHYASSQENPLVLNTYNASAAVVVTCKPGSELSEDNVHAVLRLVQMSYTGLLEKNVTIASSRGDTLWDGTQSGSVDGNNRVKQQRKMELDTRNDIQKALDYTIGPHRSLVLTHVELNSDEVHSQKHLVEPGAVTGKTPSTERLEGKGTVGGVRPAPGAGVNGVGLPAAAGAPGGTTTYSGATGDDANSRYLQEHAETTTEPTHTDIVTNSGLGKIEKLTVSVLLDSNQYKDQAVLTGIQATIKNLVETNIVVAGTDTTSTRQVSVSALPFDRSEELKEAQLGEQQRRAEQMRSLASLLVPFAIMGITLFLLARALRRPGILPASQMPALAGMGTGMAALPPLPSLMLDEDGVPIPGQMVGMGNATEDMHDDLTPIALSTGDGAPRTYEVIEEAFDANLESILHMTRSKPDMVAMLVKSWVSDEQ